MAIESGSISMLITSEHYIDIAQSIQYPVFDAELKTYVTHVVWERYIVWSVVDDHLFNVHQTQKERQDRIIKDVVNRLSACKNKDPAKELLFYRNILVHKVHLVEPELVLFKLNFARNEYDDVCLIIDAVNIN